MAASGRVIATFVFPTMLPMLSLAIASAGHAPRPLAASCPVGAGCAEVFGADGGTCPAWRAGCGRGFRHGQESVLLQLHRHKADVSSSSDLRIASGDKVFFRVARTDKRVTVQSQQGQTQSEEQGLVHAKWANRGAWEEIRLQRVGGSGVLHSGDTVLLWSHWNMPLTAENTTVHARWNQTGAWQKWVIRTEAGGGIVSGDTVFLQAQHTGKYLDVDSPVSPGEVWARWNDTGDWQALVIEKDRVNVVEWEHFTSLNALRATGTTCPNSAGSTRSFSPVPPLRFDCRLWAASRLHTQDMVDRGYFSAESPEGTKPWDRAKQRGTTASAENLGAGYGTAQGALDQFKAVRANCEFMMSAQYRVVGVGHAAGGEWDHYWSQLLAVWHSDVETWCYPEGH